MLLKIHNEPAITQHSHQLTHDTSSSAYVGMHTTSNAFTRRLIDSASTTTSFRLVVKMLL